MSKKIIIIAISILALIVVIVLGVILFRSGSNGESVTKTFDNFMPFGIPEGGGDATLPDNTGEGADLSQKEEVAVLPLCCDNSPALRQQALSPYRKLLRMLVSRRR